MDVNVRYFSLILKKMVYFEGGENHSDDYVRIGEPAG
jgi:hypothetical protein